MPDPQGGSKTAIDQAMIQHALKNVSYSANIDPTQAWMGPLRPIQPVVPPQLAASVIARALDYPAGYNLRQRPRAGENVTFEQMRNLAESCDVLRLVIETRKDQMELQSFSVVPMDEHSRPDARCEEVEAFFKLPDGENTYDQWQRMVLEDLFVLDAVAIYPWLAQDGSPFRFELIAPETIKRVIDERGRTPLPPDPAYQQVLKGVPAVNYTADELIYRVRNKRSHRIYGYSPVEQIIITVNTAIRRAVHQLQFYTEGSTPDLLFSCPPDWNMDQVRDFNDWWQSMLQGNTAARRAGLFIPAGVAPINTKDGALTDKFDEWLARIVCYAFSVSPTPFVAQVNRATAESAQEAALLEGLAPIMKWMKGLLDFIIWKYFGYTDLQVKWDENRSIDPAVQSATDDRDIRNGSKTINEVRQTRGLDPVDGGDKPLIILPNGPVELATAVKVNTQNLLNPPPPPTPPGAPPGHAEPQPGGQQPQQQPAGKGAQQQQPQGQTTQKIAKGAARPKAQPAVSPIDRDRPAIAALRRVMTKTVAKRLSGSIKANVIASAVKAYSHHAQGKPQAVGKTVRAPRLRCAAGCRHEGCGASLIAKADPPDFDTSGDKRIAQAILDQLDLGAFDVLTPEVQAVIEQVLKDAGSEALQQVGIDDQGITDVVNQNAVDYAKDRAAELVSRISDSTREMLRSDIAQALDEGWSNDDLADALADNYGFSDDRAETIARTETAYADVQGNLDAYRESGVVSLKQWITGDGCCDACDELDGVTIGLDDTFNADGDEIDGPPYHPNCRCDVIPVLADESDADAADRLAGSDDDSED
jgi:SPP1 gp7 family putative phage head morphogenesis protein